MAVLRLLGVVVACALVLGGLAWVGISRLDDDEVPPEERVYTSDFEPVDVEDYEVDVELCAVERGRTVATGLFRNTSDGTAAFEFDVLFRAPGEDLSRDPGHVDVEALPAGEVAEWRAVGGPVRRPELLATGDLRCDVARVQLIPAP